MLWNLMDQWEEEKPSNDLETSILARIRTELMQEETKKHGSWWKNIAEPLALFGAATAAAVIVMILEVKKLGPVLQSFSPLALLSCGGVWVAIYMLMFLVAAGQFGGAYRIKRVPMNVLARYALAALGLWVSFSFLGELIGVQNFAHNVFREATPAAQYFILGILYAFVPLASLSFMIRKEGVGQAPIHGILIASFFLFLLSPEILLYCGSFSAGIAVGWTAGTVLGCAAGGPFAVWLGRKGAQVSSF